ncbi:CopG family ribbon-helix-helix protein [Tabrizicola sp.]|uniref:CopG family ribbon-helix-helix protein n=1 Tax=Tabrizicola sp. TaxID=2005166 RepID=UPI002FDCC924
MSSTRFTLRLEPELKQWLEDEARRRDRSAGWVAKQAIENMKRVSEMREQLIAEAIWEADKGAFVSRKAVHDWMETWDTDHEAPAPQPDIFLNRA